MDRIAWYLFGDIDCFMRGGRAGGGTDLADALAQYPADGQGLVDTPGSATAPPGMAAEVATLLAAMPGRDPAVPTWTAADWPLDWRVNFVDATQTDVDSLIVQPGVVAFRWPPPGGASLNVSIANVQPVLTDPHTIRYGDLLMQTIDYLVTDPAGRQSVLDAAAGGPINDVDLVDLIGKTEPALATGPTALPASFTASLQEARQTTKTFLDVNPAGGVNMRLGFKEVAPARQDGPKGLLRDYPCGGFVLAPPAS